MTVGFIEDLQNATLQRHRKLDVWDQWLGVETRYWWDAVIRVWAGEKVVLKWPRQR